MASDASERYALGRLILDYLRIFIWPAILLIVVLTYREDVREILRDREFEVAGVFKIGQQVERLEAQAAEEIADVRALVEQLQERPDLPPETVAADIESKLTRLTSNLSREVRQIAPNLTPAPPGPGEVAQAAQNPSSEAEVAALERKGFQALIDRNPGEALAAFEQAEALMPKYHNVAAIRALLADHQSDLADPDAQAWSKLYRVILTRYSWGMPSDLRPKLRRLAAAY